MSNILIDDVMMLPMSGEAAEVQRGSIAVSGSKIVYAGPAKQVPVSFKADTVIGGEGSIALPGLVNCHTHAAMTLMRGYADDLPLMKWLKDKIWPLEAKLTPEDVYWGTLLCCLEMIKSGTTTFADMYFHMDETAQAVEKSGVRACLARGLIGVGPEAESGLAQGEAFVGRWQGGAGGRITTMLGPHAPYTCPPDYLRRVAQIAQRLGVGIHIHVAETRQETEDMQNSHGKTPVRLLDECGVFEVPTLAAHCVYVNDDDIALMASKNVGVAHNPESNMKLASGIAPVGKMLDAGVTVGLGTDGAASNNNLDMIGEMRSAALLQKVATLDPTVLPAGEVLKMATIRGAQALGLADEIGTLAPGKKADLVLLNIKKPHLYPRNDLAAHMVYAAHAADVDTVIIDGRVVMRKRKVLTIDEEEVCAQVEKRMVRLTAGS